MCLELRQLVNATAPSLHHVTWILFCQLLWSMFPSELATVQPCNTSWIHKVTGKRTDRPCTDSWTPVKHWLRLSMGGKLLNLNYLIEPLVGSGNYSLWMKLLLPKLREELATALMSYLSPYQCLISTYNGRSTMLWPTGSLVYSLFPVLSFR